MTSNQIFDKAHELMVELNIHELPVNPFDVAYRLHIPIVSYEEASENGFTALVNKVLREKAGADAFCYRNNGQYIIFYDEKRTPSNRINFTIAHELGHIRLDHFQQNGYYTRYQLNKKGDFKEREADSFAGELLRPPVLLALAGIETPRDISIFCSITKAAATIGFNAINSIKKHWGYDHIVRVATFFQRQFAEFLNTYYCRNCNATFQHNQDDHYCPICGTTDITHKFVLNEGGLQSIMHYAKYPTFPNSEKVNTCPRCANEDIDSDDNYCSICGAPLQNKCYARLAYDNSCDEQYWDDSKSCGQDLPANARFCPACGCESLFFKEEILKPWHVEKQEISITMDEKLPF